jgi:hypothetical protein
MGCMLMPSKSGLRQVQIIISENSVFRERHLRTRAISTGSSLTIPYLGCSHLSSASTPIAAHNRL